MKNKKIKNISLVFLFSFVFAGIASAEEASFDKNKLSLAGKCEKNITVQLFEDESLEKSAYSAGVKCENGEYEFSDDLSIWNIPEGNYALVIDGDKINVQNIDVKYEKKVLPDVQKTEQPVEKGTEKDNVDPAEQETQESADVKFLGAFAVFQQSILDMRTWLAQTKYPSWAKSGIDGALDGIDKLAGEISDLLFSADNPQSETTEAVASDTQDANVETTGEENQENNIGENQSLNIEAIKN